MTDSPINTYQIPVEAFGTFAVYGSQARRRASKPYD